MRTLCSIFVAKLRNCLAGESGIRSGFCCCIKRALSSGSGVYCEFDGIWWPNMMADCLGMTFTTCKTYILYTCGVSGVCVCVYNVAKPKHASFSHISWTHKWLSMRKNAKERESNTLNVLVKTKILTRILYLFWTGFGLMCAIAIVWLLQFLARVSSLLFNYRYTMLYVYHFNKSLSAGIRFPNL